MGTCGRLILFALSLATLAAPFGVAGQADARRLAEPCAEGGSEALVRRCADAALAAHAVSGGLGLLASAGGAFPVSPSTAGHRLEGRPRIVVDAGASFGTFRHPDLEGAEAHGRRSTLLAARVTTGVGIFDGFSLAPTVGGVGSVDAVATLRFLRLPSSDGFAGSVVSLGAGARLGIIRESFSFPGITLTVLHHRLAQVQYGSLAEHGARTRLRPRVTSTRLEIGKDLLAVGLTGGVAWDRISSSPTVSAVIGNEEGEGGPASLRQDRRYLFAGANYTWLVTQVAGEVGWAPGRSPSEELVGSGNYRAGSGSVQATLTFRIRY